MLELASSSALGRQLFQEQLAASVADSVAKTVQEEVLNLFGKTGTITPERYEEAKRTALVKVSGMDGVDALPMKRQIQLPYRCQAVTAKIGSLREEVVLHFASALKGHAVETKQLVELWCECLLVPNGTCMKYKAKLDPALLKEPNASRSMVQNLVKDSSADSADLIQKMIFQKSTALLLMDADFQVELALLSSITSDGAQGKINSEIMLCMPSAEKKYTCEETAQLLKNLASGSLFKMSSRSGQQKLRMTQQLVDAIVEGRRPETSVVAQCTFLAEVVGRFQWFLVRKVGGSTVYGVEALKAVMSDAHAKLAAKTATLADVAPLQIFGWLLAGEEKLKAETMVKAIVTSATSMADCMKSKSTASSSKSTAVKKQEDSALQKALDMFG